MPRHLLRFVAIGPLGVALGAVQYELLFRLLRVADHRHAIAWFVSAVIGVAWVHALHCRFTFRGPRTPRWRDTVGRAYLLYSASIAVGTALMWLLADEIGVARTLAWLATTAATSLMNFLLLRRLLVPRDHSEDRALRPEDITVVVPTKDERHNIDAFLDALPPEVALLVVDAGSDGTAEHLLARRPARTMVLRYAGHIAAARQHGAEAARTPWLLFTDADVTFAAGYFETLRALPLAPDVVGIAGTKRAGGRFRAYDRAFRLGQRLSHAVGIPAATGSNLLLRRDALLAAGGFDLALRVNEDSEVAWRMAREGGRFVLAPHLVVHERDHRRLERGVLRKLAHTAARCTALWLGVLPERWRAADWGYWRPAPPLED